MTKEQEAQQAIERWSHSGYEEMTPYDDGVYVLYDDHKAIVDSQAQTIENMSERIDLQTQWMLDHGITSEELGKILTQLADNSQSD